MANLYKDMMLLLFDILMGKTGDISKVNFVPRKPSMREKEEGESLPRSTPEAEGVPSSFLYELTAKLSENKLTNLHHLIVIRHGKVISETAVSPCRKGDWHISYSLCKAFTGMAIGLLIDDGKLRLEDKVMDIFGLNGGLWNTFKLRGLTIKDLLTMSSGLAFNEMGAITGNTWTKDFLNSPLKEQPGKNFSYNSMNSYILSAIVTKITEMTMEDFLEMRLFSKMGIQKTHWEISPEGVTKGGWGMFIRPEDAGKLGLLYLNGGLWNGERLLSEEFVKQATTKQIENEHFGYGYQLWVAKRPGSYNFDGMLGQNVWVYPDLDTVVVNNAGDSELMMGGAIDNIMYDSFFDPPFSEHSLPENRLAYENLKRLSESLERGNDPAEKNYRSGWKRNKEESRAFDKEGFMKSLSGKRYELQDKTNGVFPLLLQTFHNLFTDGIGEFFFTTDNGKHTLTLYEGETKHCLPIDFARTTYAELDLRGEPYLVGIKSALALDEEGDPVLTVILSYVEEVARRFFKFRFKKEKIIVEMNESPGRELVDYGFEFSAVQLEEMNFVVRKAMGAVTDSILKGMVVNKINPVTEAAETFPTENTLETQNSHP